MSFDNIFNRLGYRKGNILKQCECDFEFRNCDYILFIHNLPIIIFKEFENPTESQINNICRDFWNYSKVPILMVKIKDNYYVFNSKNFNNGRAWMGLDEKNIDDFNYFNFVSGRFWEKYESEFRASGSVNDYMLKNLKILHKKLTRKGLDSKSIFKLLIELIFVRFLVDKKIIKRDFIKKHYNESFEELILHKNKLNSFFKYLDSRFGGDLFCEIDLCITNAHLKVFHDFFSSKDFTHDQTFFGDVYDFSIIPVEIICNLYENFNEDSGIYYTPVDVVDYIVKNNVEVALNEKGTCKILDPSCGSGVFLVSSLRKIMEHHDDICEAVCENIYGIDTDEIAVMLTIFSIYTAIFNHTSSYGTLKLPHLKGKNILVGDFFNLKLDLCEFDVIIGNPPWYSAKGKRKSFENYALKHKIPISNRQIAEAFISRSADFLKDDGIVCLITTSKILYNLRDIHFRQYLLKKYKITEIVNMTLARKYIFKNTKWPSSIIKFAKNPVSNNKLIYKTLKIDYYLKLFGKIIIDKSVPVMQKDLFEHDWLFKALLVGNMDDIDLVEKLTKHPSLGEYVKNHPRLIMGVGFKKGSGNALIDAGDFIGCDYIKSDDITQYGYKKSGEWHEKRIVTGDKRLMHPPLIIIKQSYTPDFNFSAAYSPQKIVFNYSNSAIKGKTRDSDVLMNIMACINSDLFKYFFFMTGNVAIDKNRSSLREKKKFPLSLNAVSNDVLTNLVFLRLQNKDSLLDENINREILNSYDLTLKERDRINYMNDVLIPQIRNISDLKVTHDYIERYIRHIPFDGFCARVYINEYAVALKIRKGSDKIRFFEVAIDEFLEITSLESGDIEDLYFKKTIKIIKNDEISIVKMNNYAMWHEACVWSDFENS